MLKQLVLSGVLLVGTVPPALAGSTNFWGTSQVPNVECNIWGCPSAPLGAECTINGCPPSPQVVAPPPQYPQYPYPQQPQVVAPPSQYPQYPYPQQPVLVVPPYPYGQQQQQTQQPFDPAKFRDCVRKLTYDGVFFPRRNDTPQERAEQLCLGKG